MPNIKVAKFVKYVDVIGLEAVRSSPVTSMTLTDIVTFWKAHQTDCRDCQDWHRCTFFSVATTADAERSFSMYNQLLTPQRTRLAAETLRMLEFLYWNLNT